MAQIINSGNDYLIAVKGNQPKLFDYLKAQFEHIPTQDVAQSDECTRNRRVHRTTSVLDTVAGIAPHWVGVQRLIRVHRSGQRGNQSFDEVVFYISSLNVSAAEFAEHVRRHWHVENRLHWVKDVVLKEDSTPVCDGHAIVNAAILRTIALNLFRQYGFNSITDGIRQVAHDIPRLFSFFQ